MNITYKEWIKTRWFLLVALLTHLGFVAYSLLRVNRVASLHGEDHVWVVMMTHDQVFVDLLQYIPVLTGLLLGLFQFCPEMYHKCLKLTLHLPIGHLRITTQMLTWGVLALLGLTVLDYAILFGYLQTLLPVELYSRILFTSMPWYQAGLAAYLLSAWIVLEPSWPRRIFNLIVSLLVIRIYFISTTPCAYTRIGWGLSLFTLLLASLTIISITRFKEGKE